MDRETHMGTNYEGYDHECLDLYLEYIKRTNYDNVADNSDMDSFNTDDNIDYEPAFDSMQTLDFNVLVEPVLDETFKNSRYQMQIIPFTITRVARKTSVSTMHCRLNEFDTNNRTFWIYHNYNFKKR